MSDNNDPARKVSAHVERKLAAILSADVQGYSRLMGEDEEATLHTLTAYREIIDPLIHHHRGRIVGTAGDSVLAEFASVVDAVRCAVEIQQQLKARNADLPLQRRMEFRIGINLGDVMVEGEQIYGDGVNVAARLQSLADAGGIFIAGTVYDQIENKLPLQYEYLGEQAVKNIAKPVRVWRIRLEEAESSKFQVQGSKSKGESQKSRRVGIAHRAWVMVAGFALIVGAVLAVRYLSPPPIRTPQSEIRNQAEPAPALPLPDKPSIVVLAFTDMSEDPKQEYFSDGITEDLTSALSRISSLFVIARNSAFTYKGKAVNVQEISKELGVRYVLEGSVRKADGQVRITAQLIDATTGGHLWSERYDRPLKDIFALQDEIVQKIVTTLKLQLTLWEQGVLTRKTTDNLEAYDYVLRGLETGAIRERLTPETIAQARQMWEKAAELDPQYAMAYALLGSTYFLEWFYTLRQDQQVLEQAFALAQKAVSLDDSLPIAHGVLGMVYLMQKQHEQALAEAQRAVSLDPSAADNYVSLGLILAYVGRPEEAIEVWQKAMRLNPHYPTSYSNALGWGYLLTRQYDEGITVLKNAISRNPNFPPLRGTLAIIYSELGRDEEARAEGAVMLKQVPTFSLEVFAQRIPYKDPAALARHIAGLRKAGLK